MRHTGGISQKINRHTYGLDMHASPRPSKKLCARNYGEAEKTQRSTEKGATLVYESRWLREPYDT